MATIFKNPRLTDYFMVVDDVSRDTPAQSVRSYVPEYEDAKVLYFPKLKLDLDFDFWAQVPGDQFDSFKKLVCYVDSDNQSDMIDRALRKANGPPELNDALYDNMAKLFEQIMPYYYRIFGGYQYLDQRSVLRLRTTYNENLHYDTYRDEYPNHFARLFINLDNQPRIWHTSWTIDEIYERFGRRLSREQLETSSSNKLWLDLNTAAFGRSHEWWDGEPRHIIYFDPGDVWVVDSRQVSHQIFYGRRAISIDFVVTLDSMKDRSKHYFNLIEKYRQGLLQPA